jgi:hypothetical protein
MRQTQIAKPVRKNVVRELDLRTPTGRVLSF